MSKLLVLNYWFNLRPEALSSLAIILLLLFYLILAIIYIISFLYLRKKGLYLKIFKRSSSFSMTNLIIGIVLLFFSYEEVPFLSARFWFILWLSEMIIWIVFIFRNMLEIPKLKERLEKEREYKKYIP